MRFGDGIVLNMSNRWSELVFRYLLLKGGNPAAPSGTATLLRLSPSQRSRFRRWPPLRVGIATLSAPSFHGLTGGVYKARERIHRGVLTHDY